MPRARVAFAVAISWVLTAPERLEEPDGNVVFARTVRLTMEWYRDYSARPTDARALVEAQIAEYARIAAASGHADEDSA